jgi:hypothetical protein
MSIREILDELSKTDPIRVLRFINPEKGVEEVVVTTKSLEERVKRERFKKGYFLLGEYKQYKDEIDRMIKLKEWINDYEKDLKELRGIVKAIPSDLEYFAKYRPSEFESRKKEAEKDLREYAEIKKNLKSLKDELRMLKERLSSKLKREIK